jgi:GTP-binding protein
LKIRSLRIACTTLDPARFPNSPWAEIAVAGRSNVGKSSVLNTLFERKNYARISKDPGKTRTINFYAVNDRFYLVDLPGYGFARISAETRTQWTDTIYAYLEKRGRLAGVVQLIDSRHEPSGEDVRMIERLAATKRAFIVVFTKADKISRSERPRAIRDFNRSLSGVARVLPLPLDRSRAAASGSQTGVVEAPALFFSAKTEEGKEELWRWIAERI